ncbi:hypothetical protein [Cellulomonas sp.]|uniref:hypothetical protein n=1 Tax=Cellulomonas sp. TaxID=40001 RepID=UPI001AFD8D61|nr:hypothetical protein [Cellulomonas sp.]MBO9556320.1 hypothetical protein [Cellulomonas sp.]
MTDETVVTTAELHEAPGARRGRRRRAVGVVLGLGVLAGAGIATTSAAWTNDAWVAAGASAARVDLRGSTAATAPTGTAGWQAADTTGTALTFTPANITGLTPTAPVTRTVHLWNASTVPLALTSRTVVPTGAAGCVAVAVTFGRTTLAADPAQPSAAAVTTATLTFSIPGSAPATCEGKDLGAVETVLQGSTTS